MNVINVHGEKVKENRVPFVHFLSYITQQVSTTSLTDDGITFTLQKKLRVLEHETMDKHRKLCNPNSLHVTEGLLSTANVSYIRPILERHGDAKVLLCRANVYASKGNNKRWRSTVDLS